MNREEVFASVAVLALAGVLTYLTRAGFIAFNHVGKRHDTINANRAIAAPDIVGGGGDAAAFLTGPSIYIANSPWLFGANVGNVIPPNSAGVTLPGAVQADFLGFNTQ